MEPNKIKEIAKKAANIWCRCYKCDGVDNETGNKCDQKNLLTCAQWYCAYRASVIALDMLIQDIEAVSDFASESKSEQEHETVYFMDV